MASRIEPVIGYIIGAMILLGPNRRQQIMDDLSGGYSDAIKRFAEAIAWAEGYYVAGSIPQRLNNPGDLKVSAVPSIGQDAQGHLHFATPEDGWRALYRQLQLIVDGQSRNFDLSMTIESMGSVYAQSSAWAQNVAARLGANLNTRLHEVLR